MADKTQQQPSSRGDSDRHFALPGLFFIIGGIAILAVAADDALARIGVLGDRDLTAHATITEIDHTGNMVVAFHSEGGREVMFETASLSDPPGYEPPYAQGETVRVAYGGGNEADARIVDPREWIRIATLGLFGAVILFWGGLAFRFSLGGVIGGLALWLGYAAYGEAAVAALLGS